MKVFIILATIALTHGAKLERGYLPPTHAGSSGGSGSILQAPTHRGSAHHDSPHGISNHAAARDNGASFNQGSNYNQGSNFNQGSDITQAFSSNVYGVEARPERPQAALERNAAILRNDNNNDGETYSYAFETENGIYAEESGVATNGVEAQGGYSYTGDDGRVYSVRYTADQNGFVPQGDHLPTPPPIPEEILKALEQNARDEAAGIYDDGTYNEAKYAGAASNAQPQYQAQNFVGDEDTVVTNSALTRSSISGAPGAKGQAYLPPFAQAGARRQSYDARSGYRY